MKPNTLIASTAALLLAGLASSALGEIKVTVERNDNEHATPRFKFANIPTPAANDAAASAKFTVVSGDRDENGADVDALNDGKLPSKEDEPERNFFFDAGTDGGRLKVDFGKVMQITQINTYSWHPNTRGPQIYKLYASDGAPEGFDTKPKRGTDPAAHGWKLIANVNTEPKSGEPGGQYGVSISDSDGALGKFRYLLFDIYCTENEDDFGNTFYSEIDVIANEPAAPGMATTTHSER